MSCGGGLGSVGEGGGVLGGVGLGVGVCREYWGWLLRVCFLLSVVSVALACPGHGVEMVCGVVLGLVVVEVVALLGAGATRYLAQSLTRWLQARGVLGRDPLRKASVLARVQRQGFLLVAHTAAGLFSAWLLFVRPRSTALHPDIWGNPQAVFRDLDTQTHLPETWAFYIWMLSVWIYLGLVQLCLEPLQKDFAPMIIHHTATILLMTGSIHANALRAGLLVLFVNSWSDIPLDVVRITNALQLRGRRAYFISEGLFAMQILTFAFFRLYLLPFVVFPTTLVSAFHTLNTDPHLHWTSFPASLPHFPLYRALNLLFLALILLNLYWFFIMLRIIFKTATEGLQAAAKDQVDDDDDEDRPQPQELQRSEPNNAQSASSHPLHTAQRSIGPMHSFLFLGLATKLCRAARKAE